MPKHIGIVGCSGEGAALCYKTICVEGAQFLGTHAHPEISMNTLSFADYLKCTGRGDWPGVAELMLTSAGKLANGGANFLICPANTMHEALPHVVPRSPLPWLHIADAVADEATARGFKRLGILGTRWLLESNVYTEKFAARGLESVRPNATETDELHRIIIDELNCSLFKPAAVTYHQKVIARLKSEGCDAVVLACTEIPLIIDDTNSTLPTLDSTRLLARAALKRAVGEIRGLAG